ncbi:SDR family NAD(P)-dependent oxidoreductase [Microtetraspora malaysiensis]|uniref:SDR family NAD(P)-dependent oxidoreductase n=1 Tax=Microtetraspora malaysiensis TaxID=161358 RepID=UPI000AB72592|nr:SDR family oxidoreductase [Microtetraspora malaysiensis]
MAPVAVVTGAGSGLGRRLAVSLAADKTSLVLVGRRAHLLLAAREECVAAGAGPEQVLTVPADLAEPGSAARVVAAASEQFGGLDMLVNNAAAATFGALEPTDPDVFTRLFQTNVAGPAALIRHAAPLLRRSRGTVVNVGSIGGLLAVPGRSFYGATKAALHHLTRSLARELAPDIRVNAVLPGAIDTEMYQDLGLDEDATRRLREEMIRTTPLGRMGTPQDVVPWIRMLLGPDASWMTGTLLVVDGGRSC